ncbi:sulfurtransferase [Minwuia sp.]|uniref:sulfurtransferase n=1 Tax=Minwuia sp. TaxID=2493630 RepID=UPI003A9380DA
MASGADLIVTPAWVEAHLDTVRVIDCSVRFEPRPVGSSIIHSCRDAYLAAHVPGAAYLHMVDDLSDPQGAYAFTLAPQAQIDRVLSAIGVTPDDTIVVYGNPEGTPVAVTRAWWVLTVSGCRDVRIMDGGLARWTAEGRSVSMGEERFTPSVFKGQRDETAVARKAEVAEAIRGDALLINALSPQQHAGTGGAHYGRPGHIPGSTNIPAQDLMDPATGAFAPVEEIRAAFADLSPDRAAITYCGGGIAAAATLFAMKVSGHDRVTLYDNSLLEWSTEPDLPMETGEG